MASLPTLFKQYLSNIRPTDEHITEYKEAHETLRKRLRTDETVSDFYIGDGLQGSYRRGTAVRPIGDKKSDVDILFVTNFDKNEVTPAVAMEHCEPFLREHYAGQWDRNDRSYQINLETVEIDLVLTAAPGEAVQRLVQPGDALGKIEVNVGTAPNADQSHEMAEALGLTFENDQKDKDENEKEWKDDPLDIPDRRLKEWDKTHPFATIEWTLKKNSQTDGHYINVVKAIKWWRRTQLPEQVRPKGYPLEHLVGCCCPDNIESVAEGVTRTFEEIERRFAAEAEYQEAPFLPARELSETDVFGRIDGEEFAEFYEYVLDAADRSREALDEEDKSTSRDLWHSLFGDEFPEHGNDTDGDSGDDEDGDSEERAGTFSSSRPTSVSDQRFA